MANTNLKRTLAGVMAVITVAGTFPANVGGFLTVSAVIPASASAELGDATWGASNYDGDYTINGTLTIDPGEVDKGGGQIEFSTTFIGSNTDSVIIVNGDLNIRSGIMALYKNTLLVVNGNITYSSTAESPIYLMDNAHILVTGEHTTSDLAYVSTLSNVSNITYDSDARTFTLDGTTGFTYDAEAGTFKRPASQNHSQNSTVSFKKIQSGSEIDSMLGTGCTISDAAAWIQSNWDSLILENNSVTYLIYGKTDSGDYNAIVLRSDSKRDDPSTWINGSVSQAVSTMDLSAYNFYCYSTPADNTDYDSTDTFVKLTYYGAVDKLLGDGTTAVEAADWISENWDSFDIPDEGYVFFIIGKEDDNYGLWEISKDSDRNDTSTWSYTIDGKANDINRLLANGWDLYCFNINSTKIAQGKEYKNGDSIYFGDGVYVQECTRTENKLQFTGKAALSYVEYDDLYYEHVMQIGSDKIYFNGESDKIPDGIKVASGSGTQDDPFILEATYPTITYNKIDAADSTSDTAGNIEYYEGSDGKYYIYDELSESYTPISLADTKLLPGLGTEEAPYLIYDLNDMNKYLSNARYSGKYIRLMDSITVDTPFTFNKEVILDLNGNNIQNINEAGYCFYANDTLTIKGSGNVGKIKSYSQLNVEDGNISYIEGYAVGVCEGAVDSITCSRELRIINSTIGSITSNDCSTEISDSKVDTLEANGHSDCRLHGGSLGLLKVNDSSEVYVETNITGKQADDKLIAIIDTSDQKTTISDANINGAIYKTNGSIELKGGLYTSAVILKNCEAEINDHSWFYKNDLYSREGIDDVKAYLNDLVINDKTVIEGFEYYAIEDKQYSFVPAVPAACTTSGNSAYYTCNDGKFYIMENDKYVEISENSWSIPATGHKYGEPQWSWADDGSSASANFVCANSTEHDQLISANISTAEQQDATYTADGFIKYRADVHFGDKDYTDHMTVTIPKKTLTYVPYAPAACEADGSIEYWYDDSDPDNVLCFTDNEGKNAVSQADTVLEKLGHKFTSRPIWEWNEDWSEATATFVCANDDTHTVVLGGIINERTTVGKVGERGEYVIYATVEFNGRKYTSYKITKLPATTVKKIAAKDATCSAEGNIEYYAGSDGKFYVLEDGEYVEIAIEDTVIPVNDVHTFGAPTFVWGEKNTATAVFKCDDCDYEESRDAAVELVKTAPTYTENGKYVYTASVEADGVVYTDSKEVTIYSPDPIDVTYTPGDKSVNLTWNAVKGAEKYGICIMENGQWKKIAEGYKTSYTLTGLEPDTKYTITVIPMVQNIWCSDFTHAIEVQADSEMPAGFPKVETQVSGSKFKLDWTAVDGAEKYGIAVYQSGKWVVKATVNGDVTSYTSPEVAAGTYKMVVCAKVNGKWDTGALNSRAFGVTIN